MFVENHSQLSRIDSLDILRGLAIILMVFTHIFVYTINPELITNKIFFGLDKFASFFCVPLFYFVVGYTLVISIKQKIKNGYMKKELQKYIFIRAGLIYFFGLLLNLYQVGFNYIWHWSTLQIIAIGYIITYFLISKSIRIKLSIIIITLLTSFIINPFYSIYIYNGNWNVIEFIIGFIFSGGYPLIPWISFFILGSIISEQNIMSKTIIYICLFLTILSSILLLFVPITKYPASLTYIILCIIGILLINYIIYYIYDIKHLGTKLFYPLKISGMFSLTIFILHIIVGLELIKYFLLYQSLNFNEFLVVFIFIIIFISIIGFYWNKIEFKYSLDWILKTISKK